MKNSSTPIFVITMTVLVRALLDSRDQERRHACHEHHRRDVHAAALAGRIRDRGGQRDAEERVEQLLQVGAPAHRHRGHRHAVFEDQVPADDPRHQLAHRRVCVGVRAAGHRQSGGQFGITQRREDAGDSREHERRDDPRAGVRDRLADDHEDAGADDRADAERGEVQRPDGPPQSCALSRLDQLLDGLGSEWPWTRSDRHRGRVPKRGSFRPKTPRYSKNMGQRLEGKKVAFLATDGVEQVELTEPWKKVEEEGGTPELVSLESGEIQGFNHLDEGDTFKVDRTVEEAREGDYDGLVLPGGVANPDFLRVNDNAVSFARSFFEAGKPVAVICHGPWTLVEADVVRGRTITSWPSLRTDIRNAGGNWVDEEVVVDNGLVSSRKPDDLPAFCEKLAEEICEGKHADQTAGASR
jgi:protease I